MFSGIVEEMATVVDITRDKENIDLTLTCSFTSELKIDQSIAHNGVCLTVVRIDGDNYTVTAMKETLDRSNLGLLKVGDHVNVERSMMMQGRLDGHIVQGHVDETARCIAMEDADGSTYFTFEYKADREMARRGYFTVDKGSVTVNGVPHRLQSHRQHLPGGHHPLYHGEHQFPRHTHRHGGEPGIRHPGQIYRPPAGFPIATPFCHFCRQEAVKKS